MPLGKWSALILSCIVGFGAYYSFDTPSVLHHELYSYYKTPHMSDTQFEFLFSLVYSLYSLPNIVVPLLGGVMIDYLGNNYVILLFSTLVLAGNFVETIGCFNRNIVLFIVGRFIFGFGAETLQVCMSIVVSRWFKGQELAFALGVNLSMAKLASVLTDWISPILNEYYGLRAAVCFVSFLCFVCYLFTIGLIVWDTDPFVGVHSSVTVGGSGGFGNIGAGQLPLDALFPSGSNDRPSKRKRQTSASASASISHDSQTDGNMERYIAVGVDSNAGSAGRAGIEIRSSADESSITADERTHLLAPTHPSAAVAADIVGYRERVDESYASYSSSPTALEHLEGGYAARDNRLLRTIGDRGGSAALNNGSQQREQHPYLTSLVPPHSGGVASTMTVAESAGSNACAPLLQMGLPVWLLLLITFIMYGIFNPFYELVECHHLAVVFFQAPHQAGGPST